MISNILHIKAIVYLLRSDRHSRDCGEWLEFLVSCTINHCSKRRENRSSWNLAEVWSFKKKDLSLSPYDLHFIWHLTIAFPMKFLCFLHCAIYSKSLSTALHQKNKRRQYDYMAAGWKTTHNRWPTSCWILDKTGQFDHSVGEVFGCFQLPLSSPYLVMAVQSKNTFENEWPFLTRRAARNSHLGTTSILCYFY